MSRPIHSITPFTLLDFPDKVACILWFSGCNMRCPYCYNPEIVLGKGLISVEEALSFLHRRKGLLEGVVLSGGECTLHQDLVSLLIAIRQLGFQTKIDTNGTRPEVIADLLGKKLLDYVALDFKAMPHRYHAVTRSGLFSDFEKSLHLLIDAGISFEVRTTVHTSLIGLQDIKEMLSFLQKAGYRGDYYIQYAVNDVDTLAALPASARLYRLPLLSTPAIRIRERN